MSRERVLGAVLAALTVLGAFTLGLVTPTQHDFWGHLAAGELILTTGGLPATDPFSLTAEGRPWPNPYWGSQALFALLWRCCGRMGPIGLKAIVVAATFAVVLASLRHRGVGPVFAALMVLLVAWAGAPWWEVRPAIFAGLGLAVLGWAFRPGWEARRAPWLLTPLVFAAWANLDAEVPAGFAFVAVTGAGRAIERGVRGGARAARPALSRAAGLLILAGAGAALNPDGLSALARPFAGDPSIALRSDWFSPNLNEPAHRGVLLIVLLLVVALAWGRERLTGTDLLLSLVGLHAAFASLRHVPLFLVVAAGPLAAGLSGVGAFLASRWTYGPRFRERARVGLPTVSRALARPDLALGFAAALVLLGLGVTWAALLDPAAGGLARDLREERWPRRAVDFIEREALPAPLFSTHAWGGYEIWRLHPRYRTFVDGRPYLYGEGAVRDFLEVVHLRADWQEVLDRWGVRTILAHRGLALVQALQAAGWRVAFAEGDAAVLVRQAAVP